MDTLAAAGGIGRDGGDPPGVAAAGDPGTTAPGRADRPTAHPDRWRPARGQCGAVATRAVALAGMVLALLDAPGCGRSEPPAAPRAAAPAAPAAIPQVARTVGAEASGPQLYSRYCAACHGEDGDGNGLAARFLYPKPRNFREGQFRLLTTTNHVPSDEDLMRVLERGMPGSAMFPFGHLPEGERRELVAQVRQRVRGGIEDRLRREAKQFGEQVDPNELAKTLSRGTQPGPRLAVPRDLPAPGADSVARGLALYRKTCVSCHGETGKGDGVQEQKDDSGMPIRPRDFTRGIFKGGRGRDQLYARVMLGAPGTPMPDSSATLKPAEAGDLVNFILSLSDASTQERVEHQRRRLLVGATSTPFSDEVSETVWARVEPTPVVVSPLWWRDHDDPDLRVQAVHDGQALAVRMSWRDDTRDAQAVRPQDFPDMAALQLFKGAREPFLGMGAADGAVDVWLWNAAAQADLEQYADVDTAYPNMAVDQYPFEDGKDGPRAHPTERQPRGFITAWEAGNLRSDPTRVAAGGDLLAKGFGSLTMRPRVSQAVSAAGHRQGNRWVVVLRRPLRPPADAGVMLAPGDRVSIAFALWNGAARDRNGQKLVSIWHDLVLE
ncbi:MAG: ethylbenzene dehydrogenase-related protein [Isosphaerales bacterium]